MPRPWAFHEAEVKLMEQMKVAVGGYYHRNTNYYSWGNHNNRLKLGNVEIFFHYHIPVAFKEDGKLVITRNERSCTGIGRALNSLDRNKKIRIGWNNFYNELVNRLKMPLVKPEYVTKGVWSL